MTSVHIGSDNIATHSEDSTRLQQICDIVQQAGFEVQNVGVASNAIQSHMLSNTCDVMVQIAGGMCPGTFGDFAKGCGSYYHAQKFCIPMDTHVWTDYSTHDPKIYKLPATAWDDNFSGGALSGNLVGKTWQQVCNEEPKCAGFVEGNTVEELGNGLVAALNGQTASTGVGANVVEGHIWSQEGFTPQFWSQEGYTEPQKIRFTNYKMEEEYPRIRTASFESPDNIDLTEGRVAVHITGDCNEFGGIIIKKQHDNKTGLYSYQCQGFMERIMSAPVYVVANGGKTAHRLIQEYLNDIGLPDVELGEEDDYDEVLDEELYEKMLKNKDLAESTDVFGSHDALVSTIYSKIKERNDAKKEEEESSDSSSSNSSSSSSSSFDSDSSSDTSDLEALAEEDVSKEKNPMKKKPVGLYDKFTGGDFIRTLIFDYGINVDFYGDVNGIPHFDIMDMEEWTTSGWYLAPNLGMEYDYDYTFDITNVVTQVGVKNISAIDGNGELYTAEELLGIPLDEFVGRMGTIVDNPSAKGGQTGTAQGQTVYVDEEGNQYDASQVLTTNGEPSCNKCAEKNGGTKPEQKSYQKYWVNKCPGCEKEGKLKSEENVTKCECGLSFCQFCGYEKGNGSVKLIEVTPQTVTGSTTGATAGATSGSTTGNSTSGSSSGNSSSSSGSSFTNHFSVSRGPTGSNSGRGTGR